MGANEAACERVGSRMTALWENHRHPSITRLMDAVVLKDAALHLLGSPRDEYVIRAVGAALLSLGMKPCVNNEWYRRRHGCNKPKDARSNAMDLALRLSEDAARNSGRAETFALLLASDEEESSDEEDGEASEKLDFFKTYSSLSEINEDMAMLSRKSRPEIHAGAEVREIHAGAEVREFMQASLALHLSHITQAMFKGHPALPMLPCRNGLPASPAQNG